MTNQEDCIAIATSKKTLLEIREWLFDEKPSENEGFHTDWDTIEDAFYERQLFVLTDANNNPLGFTAYREQERYCHIDIMQIRPSLQNQGLGTKLLQGVEQELKACGFIGIMLMVAPIEAESFWQKMAFHKMPLMPGLDGSPRYYKALIVTFQPSKISKAVHRLELVQDPYLRYQTEESIWYWDLDKNLPTKTQPIFWPAHYKWELGLIIDDVIVEKGTIKYFAGRQLSASDRPFLYLDDLATMFPKIDYFQSH